eukprot:11212782-Lingulodinium_polyedra.AAC.1
MQEGRQAGRQGRARLGWAGQGRQGKAGQGRAGQGRQAARQARPSASCKTLQPEKQASQPFGQDHPLDLLFVPA